MKVQLEGVEKIPTPNRKTNKSLFKGGVNHLVRVKNLIKDMELEVLVEGLENNIIDVSDINRPGLQFSGFYNYFANERVQVVGKQNGVFRCNEKELRIKRLNKFLSLKLHVL